MNYKKILVVVLFAMPLAHGDNDPKAHLEMMKRRIKEQLSELSWDQIAQRSAKIEMLMQQTILILGEKFAKKDLNQEQIDHKGDKIRAFVERFNNEKNMDGFLIKELFKKSGSNQMPRQI